MNNVEHELEWKTGHNAYMYHSSVSNNVISDNVVSVIFLLYSKMYFIPPLQNSRPFVQ